MAKKSKHYIEQLAKVDRDSFYHPLDAVTLAKETSSDKYDATIDVAMRLSVDPRKADQLVRGTVNLPHGTGKTCLLYTSPSPRDKRQSRMPSSA